MFQLLRDCGGWTSDPSDTSDVHEACFLPKKIKCLLVIGSGYILTAYLWPEELHDGDLSIHAHLLDGPQPLCCDHIDLQPCVFSYEQIEVLCRGEVTCGCTSIHVKLHVALVRVAEKKMTEKGQTFKKPNFHDQLFLLSVRQHLGHDHCY